MPATSLTLLERLRKPGQTDAWERFVHLYTPLLFDWAQLQGISGADAEDLVQIVLVKLIRILPGYYRRDGQSFRGWLFVICRNEANDFHTRRSTRPLPGSEGLATVVASSSTEPEEREYRQHLVQRAVDLVRADFTPEVWDAFTQFVIEGQRAGSVARALGMTANAVYQARYRVLRRLREELGGLLD